MEAPQSAEKTPMQRLKTLTHLNMCSSPSDFHITQLTLVNMSACACGCVSVCFRRSTHREQREQRQDRRLYARDLVFFHYVGYAAVTNLECVLISLSH